MSFEVKIPLFEGPFDLLLFFIKRDELDIHDIPIAKITNDFLDYLHHLEKLNIEVASEFILVAATLMRIKAKMLLPRTEVDEQGNEIDPRQELVQHLLEYKKYKTTVTFFEQSEEAMLQREKRGNIEQELRKIAAGNDIDIELQDLDLYRLLTVYQRVMKRAEAEDSRPVHKVVPYPYTVEEEKEKVLFKLSLGARITFDDIVNEYQDKVGIIFNFLAILELLALGKISIVLGLGFNNFWITEYQAPATHPEEV